MCRKRYGKLLRAVEVLSYYQRMYVEGGPANFTLIIDNFLHIFGHFINNCNKYIKLLRSRQLIFHIVCLCSLIITEIILKNIKIASSVKMQFFF